MVIATQPKFFMTGPSYAPQTVLRSADWRAAPAPPANTPPPAATPPLVAASRTIAAAAPAAIRASPAFFANPYFWGAMAAGALLAGGIYMMTREAPGPITFDYGGMQGPYPEGTAGELFYRWTATSKGMFQPVLPAVRFPAQGWYSVGQVPAGWSARKRRVPRSDPAEADFYLDVTWPGGGVSTTMGNGLSNVHSLYLKPAGQPAPVDDPDVIPSQAPPAYQPEERRPPYVVPTMPPGPTVYVPMPDGLVKPVPVIWFPMDFDPQSPGQRTPTVPRSPVISGRAGPWNFTHNPGTDDWVWTPNPELDPGVYYPPAQEPEPKRSPTPIFLPSRGSEIDPPTQTSSPPVSPSTLRIRVANDCCPNPFGQPQESDCATAEDVLGIVQRKKIVPEKRPLGALTSSNVEAESGQIVVPYGDERFVDVVLTVMPDNLRMQSGGLSAPNVFFCGWITGVSDGERVPVSHSSQRFRLPPLSSGESVVTYTFTNGVKGVVSSLVQRYELKEFGDPILNPPE